jgi:ketosteroid isomerase-like protein
MENKWSASIPSRDLPVLQTLLAEDYAGVTSKGKVVNKRGLLAEVKKDTDTITSATNGKMDVRVFGNSAVVVGTSKEKGKDKEGKEFDRTYRWVDTWVERNGKWQCVASQAMQVQK